MGSSSYHGMCLLVIYMTKIYVALNSCLFQNREFNSNIDMKIHGHGHHREVVRWGPHNIMKFSPVTKSS